VTKSRKTKWAGHVAWEIINAYRILYGKTEKKRCLGDLG
jgi:hypothetical protein